MFEIIVFLGALVGIVLLFAALGAVLELVFHIAWIPFAIVWFLIKAVAFVVLCVLGLVLVPIVIGPLLVVALIAAVVLAPFLLIAACGAAVLSLA